MQKNLFVMPHVTNIYIIVRIHLIVSDVEENMLISTILNNLT